MLLLLQSRSFCAADFILISFIVFFFNFLPLLMAIWRRRWACLCALPHTHKFYFAISDVVVVVAVVQVANTSASSCAVATQIHRHNLCTPVNCVKCDGMSSQGKKRTTTETSEAALKVLCAWANRSPSITALQNSSTSFYCVLKTKP